MIKWLFFLWPVLVFSQSYFETIGQTNVFFLKAGNKAGWDPSTDVSNIKIVQPFTSGLTLFPNPCKTMLRISITGPAGTAMISILDIRGKNVQSIVLNEKRETIFRPNLSNGVYFARLFLNGKRIQTTRFLVVR